MPRRTGGGDSLSFAAPCRWAGVGDPGSRRCRPPGANLSCESDSRLAMPAWIGGREREAGMDDIVIRGGQGSTAPVRRVGGMSSVMEKACAVQVFPND